MQPSPTRAFLPSTTCPPPLPLFNPSLSQPLSSISIANNKYSYIQSPIHQFLKYNSSHFFFSFPSMAEHHFQTPPPHHQYQQQQQQQSSQSGTYQMVKAATAVTAGGSLLVLSGLTLAGTVIALTIATPLFVIFSPVLVPALIASALLVTGFAASGGFGVAAVSVLAWIYRYATGRHPVGADQLEQARMKLAGKGREMRDRAGAAADRAADRASQQTGGGVASY